MPVTITQADAAWADPPADPVPTTIALTTDHDTFSVGQTVTLTAVANQMPVGSYSLRIFDQTTGTQLASCSTATCSKAWVPFYTGGPHVYVAEISTGSGSASFGTTTDVQATSNQVTLTRQAWTVSLAADTTTFTVGQSVTLTATANQVPGSSSYYLRIFDQTTGAQLKYCTSTATCAFTSVPFSTGGPHTYVAEVSSGYASTTYGVTTNIQATSNQVTLTRQAWTVSLATDVTTFTVGQSVTFTATANQIPGGIPYYLRIFDQTTGTQLKYCTSTATCALTSVPFSTGGPHTYSAEVSSGYASTTYGATTDIQATSNQVTLTRQIWTVSLSTDVSTFTAGQSVTFTATANQIPGGIPYYLRIFDQTTGAELRYCTSSQVLHIVRRVHLHVRAVLHRRTAHLQR